MLPALALTLAACSPPAPPPPADAGTDAVVCGPSCDQLVVGTGTDSTTRTFRPMADGDNVYLVPGPQGSQHVWVGLRARGIDPTQPRVEMKAFRASDGLLLGQLRVRLAFVVAPEDPSVWALSSQTLIIEDDRYCSVLGGDIRITVDFDDGRGRRILSERRVRVAGIDPLALEVDREARLRCCSEMLRRCYPDGGVVPDATVETVEAGTRADATAD